MSDRSASTDKRIANGDRSRERILDAATKLMSERGYDRTTTAEIAKASGLPVSSLYWHFSSKAGLLTAVMERGNARFREATPIATLTGEGTREDKLFALFELAENAIAVAPDFVRLQMILMLYSPAEEVRAVVAEIRAQQRAGLCDGLIAVFADLGTERASAVAEAVVDFASAGFEGIFLADQSGSPRAREVIRQLARATLLLAEDHIGAGQGTAESTS